MPVALEHNRSTGLYRKLSKLQPDPANLVTHPAANRAAVKASVEAFGQFRPLVVDTGAHDETKKNVIRAGNLLAEVLEELGFDEAWIVERSFESEEEAVRLSVLDNKTAEMHEWEWEGLARHLTQVEESSESDADPIDWLVRYGFEDFEVAPLLEGAFVPKPAGGSGVGHPTQAPTQLILKVPNDEKHGPIHAALGYTKGPEALQRLLEICEGLEESDGS